MMTTLNKEELLKTGRVVLGDWTEKYLKNINEGLTQLQEKTGFKPIQRGRVIAIRATDTERLYSALKSALYLGKYHDMGNTDRFLKQMVKRGHSYEPIRGESILFLFIGVGKPVYDHLITYSVGRTTRIAGGQRANIPWGIEVPSELKGDHLAYINRNMKRVHDVINMTGKGETNPEVREQLQAVRSELPVGYIMPPFLLEFSEEALIKNVFRQRLWEQGAQGATVDVVRDMWECCLAIDKEKFEYLQDYHGTHTVVWERVMRSLRDNKITLKEFKEKLEQEEQQDMTLHDLLVQDYGKPPKNMWGRY